MTVPVVLAIETSQRCGGVALRDASGEVHIERLEAEQRHDDAMMPAIARLFERAGHTPDELDTVGVSIGPGGFTGLRIAVTTTKIFAESLGAKVIAVPSAFVAAASHEGLEGDRILVALASKGENCWVTRLVRESDRWRMEGEPGLINADELSLNGVKSMLADSYLVQPIRARCEQAGVAIIEPDFVVEGCLQETLHILEQGVTDDPLILSPLYPRPPEAVMLWTQRMYSH